MTTLILGAHRPLGLACVREVLSRGEAVIAGVQAPHRVPPALHDLRDEYPDRLTALAWHPGIWPELHGITRAIIAELPIPPAQTDEADDAASDLRALRVDQLLTATREVIAPTLAAIQFVTAVKPPRVLIQASWLGVIEEKIRGGGHGLAMAYASQLMLVRAASLDLQRAGIATVVGNAGRYRLDMAGPAFHAEIEDVARGLLAVLDACDLHDEPAFRDWRGGIRRW
jgi:NAD(P)-dependent dehydrogenase (short-subunit alcohol dehydrogenase family)